MFWLYHHCDMERLAELLTVLRSSRHRSPLQTDTIMVPDHSLGRWLQIRLAESEGVAANLTMPLPARLLWDIIPKLLPDQPDSREYEHARLRWHLFALLPRVAEDNAAVADYLAGDPREVLQLQLAEQLADLFDQYLVHRPRMLARWEVGRESDRPAARWQAVVWRALVHRLGEQHRARLLDRAVERLNDGADPDLLGVPEVIYGFGIDQLPPEYLRFLYALGRHIDVHFLLPNPSDGYWGDIQTRRVSLETTTPGEEAPGEATTENGHPLLASLGRGTRDLLRVLYSDELTALQAPELGEALAYAPPPGDTLLARVHADLIAMEAPKENRGIAGCDASVQIHACHGPLREVQVLHDQLLDLLGRNRNLHPRDIVVKTPDVAAYAPAIRSVFGSAQGRRHIPYSVSDNSRLAAHPICQSFQSLLALPLSRWAASDVLALARVPAVMRRFALDESALDTVQYWAREAGVRWGLDAGTRARFDAGALEQNSWRFGLDRLLLGLAQSEEDTLTAGVAPWSDLEGGATAALGRFWHLLARLQHWNEALQETAPATEWQNRLNAMLADLFSPHPEDTDEHRALDEVHAAVAVLGGLAECLDADATLGWEVVREILGKELAQPGRRQPFLSGGVTFCSMEALRGAPFKVVCLLGMDDGAFPRQDTGRGLNLLRADPCLGDVNRRDDDRLMFLQALTAAREVFYISYTGQDVRSGEEQPPSPLVGEWLDFLHSHYFHDTPRETFEHHLVTRQSLHPFSARYFVPRPAQPRLFTFAGEWHGASRAGFDPRTRAPAFAGGEEPPFLPEASSAEPVDIAALRRFFDNPAEAFLKGRLQIHFDALEDESDDEEPQELSSLDGYKVRARLLDQAQRSAASAVALEADALWRARGILPPPPLDGAPFADEAGKVNALLPVWRAWEAAGPAPGQADIDLTLGAHRLVGRIGNVRGDDLRILRPGELGLKYRLRAWIDYLALRAAGHDGELRLAGLDKQGQCTQFRASISHDAAREHLTTLLDLYRRGQQAPLFYMPGLAETYLTQLLEKGQPPEKSLREVRKKFSDPERLPHEAKNPYFATLLAGDDPVGQVPGDTPFCQLAEAIGEPPMAALQAGGDNA